MSEAEYQERLKHWREVAAILRQNVVQGRKVEKEIKESQVTEKAEGVTGEDGNVWSTYTAFLSRIIHRCARSHEHY